MEPEAWAILERICHSALEQPLENRAAFIAQACGGDESLRREVESLLEHAEGTGDFLNAPAWESAALDWAMSAARGETGVAAAVAHGPMTPERLGRIRTIYETAWGKDAAARETFLQRECQDDADLRKEVKHLLGARDHLPEWLAGLLLGAAGPVFDAMAKAASGMEGRHLRGYKLIREIGRGGMGTVYLAERADGTYYRQVAIKVVRAEKGNREILERFRQERDILASFDHPNIARLLDGGSTDEGLPYFVLEFVDGQPILRWCDERKLNVAQRLELFRSVCAAVQYAHQRLVVHRDLKPGNILVTKDGTVKLLDFGIAKLLDTVPTGDPPATITMMPLMTPHYASPEQVKGGPSPRSQMFTLSEWCFTSC
jgi:eukaryotic-like serine/threonine-protein kinase